MKKKLFICLCLLSFMSLGAHNVAKAQEVEPLMAETTSITRYFTVVSNTWAPKIWHSEAGYHGWLYIQRHYGSGYLYAGYLVKNSATQAGIGVVTE